MVFPYFYSFTLLVTFVMLNLFIGVILDSFANCDEEGEVLTPQVLRVVLMVANDEVFAVCLFQ